MALAFRGRSIFILNIKIKSPFWKDISWKHDWVKMNKCIKCPDNQLWSDKVCFQAEDKRRTDLLSEWSPKLFRPCQPWAANLQLFFRVSSYFCGLFEIGHLPLYLGFFVNNLSRNDLPYLNGFMKFGWPEPPHPPKKMFDFFNFSLVGKASNSDCKGPPLWISGTSVKLYFFSAKRDYFTGYQAHCPLPYL